MFGGPYKFNAFGQGIHIFNYNHRVSIKGVEKETLKLG